MQLFADGKNVYGVSGEPVFYMDLNRRHVYAFKFECTVPASKAKLEDFCISIVDTATDKILPPATTSYVEVSVEVVCVPKKKVQKLMSDYEKVTSDYEKVTSDNEKLTSDLGKVTSDNEKLTSDLGKLTSSHQTTTSV